MSDSRNHERMPDRAALEELHRAFSDDGSEESAAASDQERDEAERAEEVVDPTPPEWLSEDPSLPPDVVDDLMIIEQVPLEEDPPPARPTIRIDDGGAAVDDVGVEADAAGALAPDVDGVGPNDDGEAATDRVVDGTGPGPDAGPTIISIDDADLPDAVYIQGSLDADGSHSIVIIEDDDRVDAEGAEGVDPDARRGIEPRIRERRVAVMRAQGRRRLRWVLLAIAVVAVVVGTLAVLGSSLFSVRADQVSITGAVYTDEAALQAVVDELVGTPTLRADTQHLEDELERIPWVDEATVRVGFPRSATIEIRERSAWATYQGPDERYRVLDDEGRVLDVLDGYPFAYVLLDGPDPVDLEPGEFAPRGYAVAAELAKNLTGTVRGRVELIEVAADGSRLELVLDDGLRVRFGEARDLFAKLVRLETVLSTYPDLPPGTIDVSTREVTLPEGADVEGQG